VALGQQNGERYLNRLALAIDDRLDRRDDLRAQFEELLDGHRLRNGQRHFGVSRLEFRGD
jgi:hypothetical protein